MRRTVLVCLILLGFSTPASAIELFNKHWKEHYLTDNPNGAFVKLAQHAGCHICHIKGKKKEFRNEYGRALEQYLDAKDFPKDWVEANPEEAKRKIVEALEKVEEDLASDNRSFIQKIDAGELPAADAGL